MEEKFEKNEQAPELSESPLGTAPDKEALPETDGAQDPGEVISESEEPSAPIPAPSRGSVWRDIFPLVLGELIVSLAVIGVYLIVQAFFPEQEIFSYRVLTGVLLGSLVIIINYAALSVSVGRAVDKILALRGKTSMSEEEAAAFAEANAMKIQNTVTKSYIIRTLSMVAGLGVGPLAPVFEVIATVVPLIMFKPILYATEFIKGKMRKKK